ncbi:MAG: hypothetical protein KGJ59_07140 [Bacteroidota bacterium]|nr:hypothetical protein [Bacteroidota bacterium]
MKRERSSKKGERKNRKYSVAAKGSSTNDKDAIFCTACNASLNIFGTSPGPYNVEALKKHFAQCKQTGKFSGRFCAKLFIAEDDMLDMMWEELQPPDE